MTLEPTVGALIGANRRPAAPAPATAWRTWPTRPPACSGSQPIGPDSRALVHSNVRSQGQKERRKKGRDQPRKVSLCAHHTRRLGSCQQERRRRRPLLILARVAIIIVEIITCATIEANCCCRRRRESCPTRSPNLPASFGERRRKVPETNVAAAAFFSYFRRWPQKLWS